MEYLFDCRTERPPSCDDIVFWRDTGWKDDEDAVDALDGARILMMVDFLGLRERGVVVVKD